MQHGPTGTPIGITLTSVARDIGRAFDDALDGAGGSRSTWLVLMALRRDPQANQRELAAAVGIQGATLTHHLNAMEADGLVTRRRDPSNRRVHIVELTERGEAAFHRMLGIVIAFDRQLRAGLDDDDLSRLRQLLSRLHDNACQPGAASPNPRGSGREG